MPIKMVAGKINLSLLVIDKTPIIIAAILNTIIDILKPKIKFFNVMPLFS